MIVWKRRAKTSRHLIKSVSAYERDNVHIMFGCIAVVSCVVYFVRCASRSIFLNRSDLCVLFSWMAIQLSSYVLVSLGDWLLSESSCDYQPARRCMTGGCDRKNTRVILCGFLVFFLHTNWLCIIIISLSFDHHWTIIESLQYHSTPFNHRFTIIQLYWTITLS